MERDRKYQTIRPMANSQLPVPPLAATGEQLAEARVGLKAQRDEGVKRIEDRKRQVNQLAYNAVYILSAQQSTGYPVVARKRQQFTR